MAIQPDNISTLAPDQVLTKTQFTIQADASLFSLLTQKVYTNLIAAPIREWSTNAVDACKLANLPIRFDVHLPTPTEQYFSVRDYGTGLDPADIVGLFTVAGLSTKRDSNEFNGTLGIGRLAGLAYGDSFTVDSYHNGIHSSYLIAIEDGIPIAVSLLSQPTTEPNGLSLTLPVKHYHIDKFTDSAKAIYAYFSVKPNTNIDLDYSSHDLISLSDEFSYNNRSNSGNQILMGDVLYHIERSLVESKVSYIVIHAPIGSVSFNPGREALSYTPQTLAYLSAAFARAEAFFTNDVMDVVNSEPSYQKRLTFWSSVSSCISSKVVSTWKALRSPKYPIHSPKPFGRLMALPATFPVIVKAGYGGGNPKPIDDWTYTSRFIKAKFLVVDQATGVRPWLQAISHNKEVVTICKPNNVSYSDFRIIAKEVLADWGIDNYTLLSEAFPTVSVTTNRDSGFFACEYNNQTFSTSKRFTDYRSTTLYIELSGSKSIEPEAEGLNLAYDHIKVSKPALVGIQKKYLSQINNFPNLVPLATYLTEYYSNNPLYVIADDCLSCRWKWTFPIEGAPASYNETITELLHSKALLKQWWISERDFNALSSVVKVNFTIHKFTNPLAETRKRYPALENLQTEHYYDLGISRYMQLEGHYERTSHFIS